MTLKILGIILIAGAAALAVWTAYAEHGIDWALEPVPIIIAICGGWVFASGWSRR
jgi:hypothetical protein